MAEAELPRHADEQLDQAGLHAALLVEQAMSALPTEPLRTRFAPLARHAAQLRDANGETSPLHFARRSMMCCAS